MKSLYALAVLLPLVAACSPLHTAYSGLTECHNPEAHAEALQKAKDAAAAKAVAQTEMQGK